MDDTLLRQINDAIAAGRVRNNGGASVADTLTAALVTTDKEIVYPVRDEVPVLLEEECIHWAAFKD